MACGEKSGRKETIREMMARMRLSKKEGDGTIEDPFEKSDKALAVIRKPTGLTYHDDMALHKCPWDDAYPEQPLRYIRIKERFIELKLIDRCQIIPPGFITEELVRYVHGVETYDGLRRICELADVDMETVSTQYDSIFFNKNTYKAACLSAGSVLNAIRSVCEGETHNAFALVRPPGHHAMFNDYCGYCFFNNIAIGAMEALKKGWAHKILIVDFDVHHGQAIQRSFYDDNRVVYFSFHRYDNGKFWPHLRESSFDFIGDGCGKGYNINVSLNETKLEDKDYFTVIFNVLLPIAYEFNPDLVIYSAGYDSAIGDEKGEMNLSPGFYGQLLTLLGGLANGRQVVCLEGGYFLDSLTEGTTMTLKSLLDDPPAMVKPFSEPTKSTTDVINNLRFMLNPFWKSLETYVPEKDGDDQNDDLQIDDAVHVVDIAYVGVPLKPPYLTRDCYPTHDLQTFMEFQAIVEQYKQEYSEATGSGVCYVFDQVMYEQHKTPENFPEKPERLKKLYEKFTELKLDERCIKIPSRLAKKDELLLVHSEEYINSLLDHSYTSTARDVSYGEDSLAPILTAAGSLLNVVDYVMQCKHQSGVAMIRPPGHHAEQNEAKGFCFVSNVALAAKYILKEYKSQRILIVDFDVHHGNGTQKAFYDNNEVLYISVHQYNNGNFFPNGDGGNYDKVGEGDGLGFNVNIPFNKDSPTDFMGDSEYINVFHRIILPIAYSFGPTIVLVSAGFDAGLDDPIGHYRVTPEAFGHFIQMLKPLARGKLILALEGGYNVNTVAYSMMMSIKALLGDGLPRLEIQKIHPSALKTIHDVIETQKKYWPVLKVNKVLPSIVNTVTLRKEEVNIVFFEPNLERIQQLSADDFFRRTS